MPWQCIKINRNLKILHSYCSELSNKHGSNLILFEKFFPPTCLIRTYKFIYFRGKFPAKRLLEPPRLLILGKIPNYTRSFWAVLSSYFVVLSNLEWQASLKLSLNSQINAVWSFQVTQIWFKHNWRFLFQKKSYLHLNLILEIFPTYTLLATARLLERWEWSPYLDWFLGKQKYVF